MDRWRVIICYANGREFCCFVGSLGQAQRVKKFTLEAADVYKDATEITNVLIREWRDTTCQVRMTAS